MDQPALKRAPFRTLKMDDLETEETIGFSNTQGLLGELYLNTEIID